MTTGTERHEAHTPAIAFVRPGPSNRGVAAMKELAWWEPWARLALAAVFGGLLGIEREERGKRAGMRTHMLLALGSGVFGLVSIGAFDRADLAGAAPNVSVDVTRIASYVAAGVGFVGAGTILRSEGGVRGLTTAASLWVASAVGLCAGLGYWEGGLAGAVIGFAVLCLGRLPDGFWRRLVRGDEEPPGAPVGSHPRREGRED